MREAQLVTHPLEPLYSSLSRVLILGTMPSPKSREKSFYYAHPQNRFWPVMAKVLECELPDSKEGRRQMLLERRIALWDVLHSCTIKGADDSTITDIEVNDIASLIKKTRIHAVFTTGKKAFALYKKYCEKNTAIAGRYLSSTSPANCRIPLPELVQEYKQILRYL